MSRFLLALALVLALAAPAGAQDDVRERVDEKLQELTQDPARSAPAGWCTRDGCDTGASASLVRRRSILLPNRYWTLDVLLGRETAGVGLGWELLPAAEGQVRIFAGPAVITPWRDAETLTYDLGLFVVARW